jgi:mannose-6-phosphate isomerase-like protein (cupin superfamily)
LILADFGPVIKNPETKTVEKVWGQEFWFCNTPHYGCKLLSLKKDFQCSLHYHVDKSETFIVLSGFVKLEVPDVAVTLQPGDRYNIHPGMEHRFSGVTDALILEVSTFHQDSDSYRLEESRKIETKHAT